MTHVSKNTLSEKDFSALYAKMNQVFCLLRANSSRQFCDDFFTDVEKIMLTKRLSAIIMFQEECSSYRVAETLKISPSTAERLKLKFDIGKFSNIVRILEKERKTRKSFWDTLEVILMAGLPPRGKGRWRHVFNKEQM